MPLGMNHQIFLTSPESNFCNPDLEVGEYNRHLPIAFLVGIVMATTVGVCDRRQGFINCLLNYCFATCAGK
jgi:hypothetical protein